MATERFALIFEGPQGTDAESMRRLKAVFIGELSCSIEETVHALEKFPVTVKTSASQDVLDDLLVALITAGGKARIEELLSESDAQTPKNLDAPMDAPHTAVFEFETVSLESAPLAAQPLATSKSETVPVLTPGQSSLLSLDDDFHAPADTGSGNTSSVNSSPVSSAGSSPGSSTVLATIQPATNAPRPNLPPTSAPAVKTGGALGELSLDLADPDPALVTPIQSAHGQSHLIEHELEIHFESEEPPPLSTPSSQLLATEPLEFDTPGHHAALKHPSPSRPVTQDPPVAVPSPILTAKPTEPVASTTPAASPPPSNMASPPAPSAPQLIPTPPAAAVQQAVLPQVVPQIAAAPATIASNRDGRSAQSKVLGVRVPSIVRDLLTSVVVPLVILVLGNVIYFSFIATPGGHPLSSSLPNLQGLLEEDLDSAPKLPQSTAAEQPKIGPHAGTVISGDFKIDWKAELAPEQILSLSIAITPPAPRELTPEEIVVGKKPPLKVVSIEADTLTLTKVGPFSISGSGPARLAIVDDKKTLRAVADLQAALSYDPKKDVLSGDLVVKTDNVEDTPLRWVAERTESGRPKLLLKLSF